MNTLNPLAPAKKYRITYKKKLLYADVVDYDPASSVLTADGVVIMIFHPNQLTITETDAIIQL